MPEASRFRPLPIGVRNLNDPREFVCINAQVSLEVSQRLDLSADGILHKMLMEYWKKRQPLPADDRKMAAVIRTRVGQWRRHKAAMAEFFDLTPDGYVPSALSYTFCRPGEDYDQLLAESLSPEGDAE